MNRRVCILNISTISYINLGLLFSSCDKGLIPSEVLTSHSFESKPNMACDACHAYPLTDRNHDYHLTTASSNRLLNGRITCLDCHNHSIRGQSVILFDTLYLDTANGEKSYTSLHPNVTDMNSQGRIIRNLALIEVDTLFQNHPIAQADRPGAQPQFQEYVTALAHLNGFVDVAFDPRNSSPDQYGGDSASFDPRQETCSAVACHTGGKDYRWAAPNKGLPALPKEIL